MDKYRFYTEQEKNNIVLGHQLNHYLKQTISRKTGIVKTVFEHYAEPDIPSVYNFSTILCHGSHYGEGYFDAPQNNGAAGFTRNRSYAGAIGESIERYTSTFQEPRTHFFATYNEMVEKGLDAFDPEKVALFSDAQYEQPDWPFVKFTRDSKVAWTTCEGLNSDGKTSPRYLPAWMCYMPYARFKDESAFGYGISTGMAAGPIGSDRSTLSGLLETIERDAYMIVWHNRLPVPKIDWQTLPKVRKLISERFPDAEHTEITLSLVTMDIDIPCMIATRVDNNSPNSCLTLGVAADTDIEKCALQAVKEMIQDFYYIRYLVRSKGAVEMNGGYSHIDDFEKRVVLWGYPEMLHHYDFLRKEPKETLTFDQIRERHPNFTKPLANDKERISHILQLLADKGFEVVRKELTTSDISDIGVQVHKTMAPQLVGMEGDHNRRFFGAQRLYDLPVQLGYRSSRPKESEFNPVPHPLP